MTLQTYQNDKLNFKIQYIKTTEIINNKEVEKYWFKGKELAERLGYSNQKKAIQTHVSEKYKKNTSDFEGTHFGYPSKCHPDTIFINESGLYELVLSSKLPQCEAFKEWVLEEVLPSIRKSGEYKVPERTQCRQQLTFKIETEQDLHYKTVNFLRNLKQYDLILIAGGGELQDSKNKRIDQYNKGYSRGQPDLIIANPNKNYNGLCIEFKSPTGKGTVSEYQYDMLDKYRKIGYKTMISNSYDDILSAIVDYLFDLRIVCQYCPRKFKNKDTLENHCKYFHKIVKQ